MLAGSNNHSHEKVKPWWNIKQLFFAIYELKLCSSTSITWTLNMVWEKLKKKTMTHIKMRLRIGTAKCATVGFPGGRSHSVIIIWEGLILTLIIFTRQQGWVKNIANFTHPRVCDTEWHLAPPPHPRSSQCHCPPHRPVDGVHHDHREHHRHSLKPQPPCPVCGLLLLIPSCFGRHHRYH